MSVDTLLDCARSPLNRGITLVEASAGTGKTYAIAMMVLRAVTEQAIPLEKILVVTFTRAATEELRGRIRQRLVEAREILQGGKSEDRTITDWAATVDDPLPLVERIRQALASIDRAAIFTIHSFCLQMLTEQALESGQLFDIELKGDVGQVREEVVADFWRKRLYTMEPTVCGAVIRDYPTPSALAKSVAAPGMTLGRIVPDDLTFADAREQFLSASQRFITWLVSNGPELNRRLIDAKAAGQLKKDPSEKLDLWWKSVISWSEGCGNFPKDLDLFTTEGITAALNGRKVKKKDQEEFLSSWPLADTLALELLEAKNDLLTGLRRDLAVGLQVELTRRLQQQGHMSFDDLIVRLDNALTTGARGLKRELGERFSMALIDEFQDTDAAQWRIFYTLFGEGKHYLYLIGDPKQAIYRFRGADIYSYFEAKVKATDQRTLASNYRSHPLLVDEVNRLFSGRSRPFAMDEDMLGFSPVLAAKEVKDGELRRGDAPLPAINYCHLTEDAEGKSQWSSGKARENICAFVVREICKMLDPVNPVAIWSEKEGNASSRPLVAKDIAILVRSHQQADEYMQALTQAGVPVVMASRKSIFDTVEAHELFSLLSSLTSPGDVFSIKRAIVISWFGLTGNALLELWQDDHRFDAWLDRFSFYHQLWLDKGFLVMINRLLADENVFQTLTRSDFSERRIANIHHLVELVQEAENSDKLAPEQTLGWLRSMIAGRAEGDTEDQELRLESDEEAVRIVTMHSSKGLQYPVVFCPVLWHRSDVDAKAVLVSCHENGELVVDLGSPDLELRREKMVAESLAEELRLAYVALTRAELCCYTMWVDVPRRKGSVASSFSSGLGYLLFPEGACDLDYQQKKLSALAGDNGVAYRELQEREYPVPVLQRAKATRPELSVRQPSGRSLLTDYQMSSYSAMANLTEQEDHGHDGPQVERTDLTPILHTGLPAGASFGNLIHDCLEKFPFAGLAKGDRYGTEIEQLCRRYGMREVRETVQALLATVVSTPLAKGENGFSLHQLDQESVLPEMAFYFHMNQLDTRKINQALADDPAVRPLGAKAMEGYLTGFVDLVCLHSNRYYILDYKTNYLGQNAEDYDEENLTSAMASHNYGLQYWIYSLVLHRYLEQVVPDYDYDRHFGGVYYLFVRGMRPEVPGSGVFATTPDFERLMALDRAVGGEGDE